MKEPGKQRSVTRIILPVLVFFLLAWIIAGAQPVLAQRSGNTSGSAPTNHGSTGPYTPPGLAAREGTIFDKRESSDDVEVRMLRRRAAAELAEDFERLRRISREKVILLWSAATVDYKELSHVIGDINSRAKRIKSNSPLWLKEKRGEKRVYDADAGRLGSMLPELSRLIESFLANPFFHTTSLHDHELRSSAGRDLESIIRLSDTINKITKRLLRTPTQSS